MTLMVTLGARGRDLSQQQAAAQFWMESIGLTNFGGIDMLSNRGDLKYVQTLQRCQQN
jgi:hypothetical protein